MSVMPPEPDRRRLRTTGSRDEPQAGPLQLQAAETPNVMRSVIGTTVLLLVLCLTASVLAKVAQAAVPLLLFIIVMAAIVRLARPPRRRR